MKNYTLFLSLLALFCLFSLVSCQKGQYLESAGYGKLFVSATFENGSKPLLLKIDGTTKDTLSTIKPATSDLIVLAGPHKVSFVNTVDNRSLKDSTVIFEIGKSITLPKFWYRSGIMLFDDYDPATMPKPANGNIFVRFVTTADALPADMKIEVMLKYAIGRTNYKITTGKIVQHVSKNNFSEYVELPDPKTFAPANAVNYQYALDGYDNASGTKVMGPGTGSSAGPPIIYNGGGTVFVPNTVWSYAIISSASTGGLTTIFSKVL